MASNSTRLKNLKTHSADVNTMQSKLPDPSSIYLKFRTWYFKESRIRHRAHTRCGTVPHWVWNLREWKMVICLESPIFTYRKSRRKGRGRCKDKTEVLQSIKIVATVQPSWWLNCCELSTWFIDEFIQQIRRLGYAWDYVCVIGNLVDHLMFWRKTLLCH